MLKLLFIRHGESTGNRDQQIGHLQDDLTLTGQQQCRQLAQYLYQQDWQPTHIYTSPLYRAIRSVAYLLEPWEWLLPIELLPVESLPMTSLPVHSLPLKSLTVEALENSSLPLDQDIGAASYRRPTPQLTVSKHLMEFQAGILMGLTWAEAKSHYPDLCHTLETVSDWVPIPQAETPVEGRERADQLVQQLLTHHAANEAIWIMSHHWIMEHLIASLMGCDRTWRFSIPNTALFEFWLDRDRWFQTGTALSISDYWQIKRFCDCPHLSKSVASG